MYDLEKENEAYTIFRCARLEENISELSRKKMRN